MSPTNVATWESMKSDSPTKVAERRREQQAARVAASVRGERWIPWLRGKGSSSSRTINEEHLIQERLLLRKCFSAVVISAHETEMFLRRVLTLLVLL